MHGFATAQEEAFPADTVVGKRFADLGLLLLKIDELGSRQAQEKGSAKAATEAKRAVRERIRQRMKSIRDTAVSVEGERPGVSQNFNMPDSTSDESLTEAARAFMAAATPLKSLFLSREMPENFLEELAADVRLFEGLINEQNLHNGSRTAASTLLKDACAQVLTLRRELDPIVRNKYRNDPERLTLWEAASRLERQARKGSGNDSNDASETSAGVQT
jgi:hypothetical protein